MALFEAMTNDLWHFTKSTRGKEIYYKVAYCVHTSVHTRRFSRGSYASEWFSRISAHFSSIDTEMFISFLSYIVWSLLLPPPDLNPNESDCKADECHSKRVIVVIAFSLKKRVMLKILASSLQLKFSEL